MPIAVQCPECSSRLNAPDAAAGKTLSCPKCNAALHVPAAAPAFEVVDEAPPPPPKPAPPRNPAAAFPAAILVDDDEDDDEVPRGKGRKKGPGKPKSRGPLIAAVATVLLVGGFAAYWFGFRTKTADAPAVATKPPVVPPGRATPAGMWTGFSLTNGFQTEFPWGTPSENFYGGGLYSDLTFLQQRLPAVREAKVYSTQRLEKNEKGEFPTTYEFGIVRIAYRPASTPATRQQALDEAVKVFSVWPGLKPGAPKPVTWADKPAQEIVYADEQAPAGKRQTVLRFLNTDDAGYLGFVRDSGELRPQDITMFFSVFQLRNAPKSTTPPPVKPPDVVAKKPVEVPADWPRADFARDTFRVAFPAAPLAADQLDKILTSYKIAHDFQAATVDGALYQAGSFQYPDGAADEEKEQMRIKVATAVGIANPPPRHVNLTREGVKWAEYRRRTTPAGKVIAYVRFHEVDSTVHVLAARGLDTMTPPAEWERFAASYELRKP